MRYLNQTVTGLKVTNRMTGAKVPPLGQTLARLFHSQVMLRHLVKRRWLVEPKPR
jgi:hypothetical protein